MNIERIKRLSFRLSPRLQTPSSTDNHHHVQPTITTMFNRQSPPCSTDNHHHAQPAITTMLNRQSPPYSTDNHHHAQPTINHPTFLTLAVTPNRNHLTLTLMGEENRWERLGVQEVVLQSLICRVGFRLAPELLYCTCPPRQL